MNTLSKIVKQLLGYIPTRLPIGLTEFEAWYKDIITTYDLLDNDSIKWAVATMVLQGPPAKFRRAKSEFVHLILKGMASEVATQVMLDLKAKQKAAIEAAKLAATQSAESPSEPQE